MATDDFNRASGADLGTNWTPQNAGVNGGLACKIINNAEASWDGSAEPSCEYWNAEDFDANHYSEVTLASPLETNTGDITYGAWAVARINPGALQKYFACARTGEILIVKADSGGGYTQQGSTYSGTVSVSDVIRIEAENSGSDVLLRAYQNGVQRVSTTDVAPGTPFTTATKTGVGGTIANDVSAITAWASGNLVAGTTSPPLFRGS